MGGVGRDISRGYPVGSADVPEAEDFINPYYELYFHYYLLSRLQLLFSTAFSITNGSINFNLGGNYTFLSKKPFYCSAGLEFTSVFGSKSYSVTLNNTTSSIDNKYRSFGARIPLFFSFAPSSWFTLTGGLPFYINYFMFSYSNYVPAKEQSLDFAPSLYLSMEFKLSFLRLMPQISILYIKNPVSEKRIFTYYPALGVGLEF